MTRHHGMRLLGDAPRLRRTPLAAAHALRATFARYVDPRRHLPGQHRTVLQGHVVRKHLLVAARFEFLPVRLVEPLTDEPAEDGMHPVLPVQRHRALDPILPFTFAQLGEQPLEEALTQRGSGFLLDRLLELALDVRLEQVRKLPVIAHEDDPPLRAGHGDQEVERIRPRRLVHDHRAEHRVFPALGVRHRPTDHLLAGRGEHHRVVPHGVPDPGGVVLQRLDPLGNRDIRTGCGLLCSFRQGVDHAHDRRFHIGVRTRRGGAVVRRPQPIDESVPGLPEPSQQLVFDGRFGVLGSSLFKAGRLLAGQREAVEPAQTPERLVGVGRSVVGERRRLDAERAHGLEREGAVFVTDLDRR